MYISIKGIYDNGQIILEERAPFDTKTEVIVTFLTKTLEVESIKGIPGGLHGKVARSEDFDKPLDDLKDSV